MTKTEIEDQIQMWVELAVHKFQAKEGIVILGECSEESVKALKSLLLEVVEAVTPEDDALIGDEEDLHTVHDGMDWGFILGYNKAISEIKSKTSELLGENK